MNWLQLLLRRLISRSTPPPPRAPAANPHQPPPSPPPPGKSLPVRSSPPEGAPARNHRPDDDAASNRAAPSTAAPVQPAGSKAPGDPAQLRTAGPTRTPSQEELIEDEQLLEDLSGVVYAPVPGGYPLPPVTGGGTHAGIRPLSLLGRSRATEKSTTLPVALATELIQELSSLSDRLAEGLASEPVLISLPEPIDRRNGYRVAGVAPELLTVNREGLRIPRTLAQATQGKHADGDRSADALDRLELVRLVGAALERLHAEELFTSGLELSSFAFVLDPRPAVMLLDPDRVRRIGGEFLTGSRSRSGVDDSLDSDRYEFALLAHRLLVDDESPMPDLHRREHVPGLTEEQHRRLWGLWERAAGPSGSRPQISEWMAVLLP